MQLTGQRGQALLLAVMVLGVVMAGVMIFGSKREEDVSKLVKRLDTSQSAYEALAATAKRVQNIYANESGCDPETLEARLGTIPALPANASSLGISATGLGYVVAMPAATNTADRENRCSGGTGCRQLAIPLDNYVYIVTVGAVSRDPSTRAGDCPRDASIRLSVAVNGSVFFQRFTLTNLCTLASCNGTGFLCALAACTGTNTDNLSVTSNSTLTTDACGSLPIRKFGSIVGTVNSVVSTNDLRWARRFLETGGADVGESNFMNLTTPLASGNGACDPASSFNQCRNRSCIPAFDLNRDGANNEADITILENYLRGYLSSLPVNELP